MNREKKKINLRIKIIITIGQDLMDSFGFVPLQMKGIKCSPPVADKEIPRHLL
jgi:hypothetical protein